MIKAVLILFLSLATFINAGYDIEQTVPYACTLPLRSFHGHRKLVGKQGAIGCINKNCEMGADHGVYCADGLKCEITQDFHCTTKCIGTMGEGQPCMHGPCGDTLACIKGTCQKYDRTKYLTGEYADNGECVQDDKFCLNKYASCVKYNKRYHGYKHFYTTYADYCSWPNKYVDNPNYNIIGLPHNTSACFCNGELMPLGSSCLNTKCEHGYTCFQGKCVEPKNIGKKCNSKETN